MSPRHEFSLASVIIATYNRSRLLPVAVESVMGQTYPAVEVIVVDDGSTDDTEMVMKRYAGRVTYIKQENQGMAAARNTGIRAAHGEYINVLDDDDFFLPTKIARQVRVLGAGPSIALVYCGYYEANAEGVFVRRGTPFSDGNVLKELVCGCFLVVHAPLTRRRTLDKLGLFGQTLPWPGSCGVCVRRVSVRSPRGSDRACAHGAAHSPVFASEQRCRTDCPQITPGTGDRLEQEGLLIQNLVVGLRRDVVGATANYGPSQ